MDECVLSEHCIVVDVCCIKSNTYSTNAGFYNTVYCISLVYRSVYERIFILVRIEYRILFALAKLSESNSEYYSCCKIYSNNIRIVQNIRIFKYFELFKYYFNIFYSTNNIHYSIRTIWLRRIIFDIRFGPK